MIKVKKRILKLLLKVLREDLRIIAIILDIHEAKPELALDLLREWAVFGTQFLIHVKQAVEEEP